MLQRNKADNRERSEECTTVFPQSLKLTKRKQMKRNDRSLFIGWLSGYHFMSLCWLRGNMLILIHKSIKQFYFLKIRSSLLFYLII